MHVQLGLDSRLKTARSEAVAIFYEIVYYVISLTLSDKLRLHVYHPHFPRVCLSHHNTYKLAGGTKVFSFCRLTY